MLPHSYSLKSSRSFFVVGPCTIGFLSSRGTAAESVAASVFINSTPLSGSPIASSAVTPGRSLFSASAYHFSAGKLLLSPGNPIDRLEGTTGPLSEPDAHPAV